MHQFCTAIVSVVDINGELHKIMIDVGILRSSEQFLSDCVQVSTSFSEIME